MVLSALLALSGSPEELCKLSEVGHTIRATYASPARLGARENRRVTRAIRCLPDPQKARARRLRADMRRWRRGYDGTWTIRRKRLSSDQRAMLARLRGCETRGIAYPSNYQHNGHHDGAFQYTVSTWARAQAFVGVPNRYRRAPAYNASPAHQDVVTAYFFPAHRSEWACGA